MTFASPKLLLFLPFALASLVQGDLIAHYKLDETEGTIAINSLGGDDGTISGATIDVEGKVGRAYSFSGNTSEGGTNDWVDMGDASFLADITASGQATLSAWIKTTTAPSPGGGGRDVAVFAGNVNSMGAYIDIANTGDGTIVGRNRDGAPGDIINEWFGDDSIINDEWHHVAFVVNTTVDEQSINLYVDGVLDNDNPNLSRNPIPAGLPVLNNFEIGRLGRSSPTDYFIGSIDDVQVYDSALNATQIASLFATPGSIAPPAEEAAGFQITDVEYDSETGMVTLTWVSLPGRTYAIHYSEDLIDFTGEVDASLDSQGSTTTLTFPRPNGITHRAFFQVTENPL